MSETDAAQLDQALRKAGLPVIGVSLVQKDDKTTWFVQLEKTATDADRTQAASIVQAFVATPDAPPVAAVSIDEVLTWSAQKFGVDPADARRDILAARK